MTEQGNGATKDVPTLLREANDREARLEERIAKLESTVAQGSATFDDLQQADQRHETRQKHEDSLVLEADVQAAASALGISLESARRFSPGRQVLRDSDDNPRVEPSALSMLTKEIEDGNRILQASRDIAAKKTAARSAVDELPAALKVRDKAKVVALVEAMDLHGGSEAFILKHGQAVYLKACRMAASAGYQRQPRY